MVEWYLLLQQNTVAELSSLSRCKFALFRTHNDLNPSGYNSNWLCISVWQLASINGGQRFNSMNNQIPPAPTVKNCIQLAACGSSELLPMNPELPADLFTACLTTPIKVALRW